MRLTRHSESLEEPDTGSTDRFLGQNSIPALLRDQSTPEKNDGIDIRQDMRSILGQFRSLSFSIPELTWQGLDVSSPFPLMAQHHLHSILGEILNELPSDREVMKYVADGPQRERTC